MLFPNLEIEGEVQINDKTRFNGIKSYVSRGASAIAALTIKPGADGSAIDCFAADEKDRYLDWEFNEWTCDIVASNKYIDFSEGGTIYEAVLNEDTYTLAELILEIEDQLNSSGALTYMVSVSGDDKITIAANGQFALLPVTGDNAAISILKHIGFTVDTSDTRVSMTGKRVEYLHKLITIEVADSAAPTPVTQSFSKLIKLFSVDGDKLFSADEDLTAKEPEILNWVTPGRNTFKDVHRRAQKDILADLDEKGYVDVYDKPYTKASVVNVDEVNQWATFMALRMIYEGIHNSKDDVFREKAKIYESQEIKARNRAILRLDVDGDGKVDINEGLSSFSSGRVSRR